MLCMLSHECMYLCYDMLGYVTLCIYVMHVMCVMLSMCVCYVRMYVYDLSVCILGYYVCDAALCNVLDVCM